MTVMVASRPLVVHEATGTVHRAADATEGYEMRPVNLAAVGYLLRMQVADFDSVWIAAALQDIKRCPCCRGRRRGGA